MKRLITIMFAMFSLSAAAQVYECDAGAQGRYLIALKNDSGIVYKSENDFYQPMGGTVKVARAMDGGPTFVSARPAKKTDWSDNRCFAMTGAQHDFFIRLSSRGDAGSTLQFFPVFQVNPKKECENVSLPRPMVLPPQPINCELMK